MSAEDLENYETDAQMALYREYKDVMSLFSYAVETDRRFYLANQVDVTPHAVSYTHLDVYKRQASTRSALSGRLARTRCSSHRSLPAATTTRS